MDIMDKSIEDNSSSPLDFRPVRERGRPNLDYGTGISSRDENELLKQ